MKVTTIVQDTSNYLWKLILKICTFITGRQNTVKYITTEHVQYYSQMLKQTLAAAISLLRKFLLKHAPL